MDDLRGEEYTESAGRIAFVVFGLSHITFWVLMVWAWVGDAMPVNTRVVFLVLWFVGLVGLPLLPYGEVLFSPFIAIVDIILVFILFKGDIRIR